MRELHTAQGYIASKKGGRNLIKAVGSHQSFYLGGKRG